MTRDIDLVLDLSHEQVEPLGRHFPADDFDFDEAMVHRAIAERAMFSIIHGESGFKIDGMVLANTAFGFSEFARRGWPWRSCRGTTP